MKSIQKVGLRNKIKPVSKRCTLSEMISESYKTLYNCEVGSKLYRLAECHIANVKNNFEDMSVLTKDLSVLKGLVSMGKSARIYESDIPEDTAEFTDEMNLKKKDLGTSEDLEKLDDEDVINEEDELDILDDEDVINEDEEYEDEDLEENEDDEEILENEDEEEEIIEEDEDEENEILEEEEEDELIEENEDEDEEELIEEDDEEELEEDDSEITDEEMVELKKHLKEMRKARKIKESVKSKKSKYVKENRTWVTEASSMRAALKHFRESSTNKAFYNTLNKMSSKLGSKKPLTLQESISLYKATNSAMTQMAVELEHNPEFIYTFKECTAILSKDIKALLECIKSHRTPSASLTESLFNFSKILLESEEDIDNEIVDDTVLENEDNEDVVVPEEDIVDSEDIPVDDEEILENEDEEEEIIEEDEDDTDITDEEAEALKNKLEEIRKAKKLKESKTKKRRK